VRCVLESGRKRARKVDGIQRSTGEPSAGADREGAFRSVFRCLFDSIKIKHGP